MLGKTYSYQQKIAELTEREKELKCLYRVEELINQDLPVDEFFFELLKKIPYGWQHPGLCRARVTFNGKTYAEPGWDETTWVQQADIEIDDQVMGHIEVFYIDSRRNPEQSQFLPEEQKLLNTIANRVAVYLFKKKLENSLSLLKEKTERQEVLMQDCLGGNRDSHWKWRYRMAVAISERLDFERFKVKGIYLIGSAKEASAGPASDIDLLIHIGEKCGELDLLLAWINGWSLCLSEINYSRTGYKTDGLIDLHIVTDEDIRNRTSFAVMIGSTTNPAKPIKTLL